MCRSEVRLLVAAARAFNHRLMVWKRRLPEIGQIPCAKPADDPSLGLHFQLSVAESLRSGHDQAKNCQIGESATAAMTRNLAWYDFLA